MMLIGIVNSIVKTITMSPEQPLLEGYSIDLLKDVNIGNSNPSPYFSLPNGKALFFATTQYSEEFNLLNETGIYVTDGTEAGTLRVTGFDTMYAIDYASIFNIGNGKIIFEVMYAGTDYQIWITDGTEIGTTLVCNRGQAPLSITKFSINGKALLLYRGDYDQNNSEIWSTDGTEIGTVKISEGFGNQLSLASYYDGQTSVLNQTQLIFYNSVFDGTSTLWVTDGTPAGTYVVKDNIPGNLSGLARCSDNKTVFWINESDYSDFVLWTTDGTENGTVPISPLYESPIARFIHSNGNYFFMAGLANVYSGIGLWQSDGTAIGTVQLADFGSGMSVYEMMELNSTTLICSIYTNGEYTLGILNLNNAILSYIQLPNAATFAPFSFFSLKDGRCVFIHRNEATGVDYNLMITDGTQQGTNTLVENLRELGNFKSIGIGRAVFFIMNDFASNNPYTYDVWATDGTVTGTGKIKTVPSGDFNLDIIALINNNSLLLSIYNQQNGAQELPIGVEPHILKVL